MGRNRIGLLADRLSGRNQEEPGTPHKAPYRRKLTHYDADTGLGYEDAVCLDIASTVSPDTPIQRILYTYWQRVRCKVCFHGGFCEHRDRKRDLGRVMRFVG